MPLGVEYTHISRIGMEMEAMQEYSLSLSDAS